jgi:hypothetical protein
MDDAHRLGPCMGLFVSIVYWSLSNIIISVVVALVLVNSSFCNCFKKKKNSSFCNVPHWISVHMHEPVFYNIFPRFKNMGMFRFVLSQGILNLTNFQDKSSIILALK